MKHVYNGPAGKFHHTLTPGDIVELTEKQAQRFAHSFEPHVEAPAAPSTEAPSEIPADAVVVAEDGSPAATPNGDRTQATS